MNTLIVGQELLDSFVDLGYVFFIHFIFDFFLVAGVFDELIENFNGFKADVFLHKVPIVELEEISQIFFLENCWYLCEDSLKDHISAGHIFLPIYVAACCACLIISHQFLEIVEDDIGKQVQRDHWFFFDEKGHNLFIHTKAGSYKVEIMKKFIGSCLNR